MGATKDFTQYYVYMGCRRAAMVLTASALISRNDLLLVEANIYLRTGPCYPALGLMAIEWGAMRQVDTLKIYE